MLLVCNFGTSVLLFYWSLFGIVVLTGIFVINIAYVLVNYVFCFAALGLERRGIKKTCFVTAFISMLVSIWLHYRVGYVVYRFVSIPYVLWRSAFQADWMDLC